MNDLLPRARRVLADGRQLRGSLRESKDRHELLTLLSELEPLLHALRKFHTISNGASEFESTRDEIAKGIEQATTMQRWILEVLAAQPSPATDSRSQIPE